MKGSFARWTHRYLAFHSLRPMNLATQMACLHTHPVSKPPFIVARTLWARLTLSMVIVKNSYCPKQFCHAHRPFSLSADISGRSKKSVVRATYMKRDFPSRLIKDSGENPLVGPWMESIQSHWRYRYFRCAGGPPHSAINNDFLLLAYGAEEFREGHSRRTFLVRLPIFIEVKGAPFRPTEWAISIFLSGPF